MGLALDMAERALGQTGINPVVGAVVVKNGAVIGMGTHLKRGTAHAEVHALNMAGAEAEDSTVYVSLEPCSHYGMTPPCSQRLIREKVKRVVVACEDPNPSVAGRGIEMLRESGIEVEVGVLRERAIKLNRKFNKYITTKLPYITLKTASTLDGKIASKSGDSKWISNEAAREIVHTLRHQHQSILVGVGTVIADDPLLTTRLSVPGLSPVRIIVDSALRVPGNSQVLTDGKAPTILLTTSHAAQDRIDALREQGIEIIICGDGPEVDLELAMRLLGEREMASILVEGGGRINGSMLQHHLVDELMIFMAPKLIGGLESPGSFIFDGYERMQDSIVLKDMEVELIGDNICVKGQPMYSV
nr:bifunctional diaminohydroxyphosphoribosylaminopyrimidine deaminase/5-amino-6-(5-phosphoribosylamino)uracil reductase RibD [Paenibacillus sp. 79R4]